MSRREALAAAAAFVVAGAAAPRLPLLPAAQAEEPAAQPAESRLPCTARFCRHFEGGFCANERCAP